MSDLLPCPFCGSDAQLVQLTALPDDDPNYGGAFIECVNGVCAATTNVHFGEYERPLREKWNRRAPPSADAEDAARFRYWFSPDAKSVDMNGYLQGIRESWSVEQWRVFVDAARREGGT